MSFFPGLFVASVAVAFLLIWATGAAEYVQAYREMWDPESQERP